MIETAKETGIAINITDTKDPLHIMLQHAYTDSLSQDKQGLRATILKTLSDHSITEAEITRLFATSKAQNNGWFTSLRGTCGHVRVNRSDPYRIPARTPPSEANLMIGPNPSAGVESTPFSHFYLGRTAILSVLRSPKPMATNRKSKVASHQCSMIDSNGKQHRHHPRTDGHESISGVLAALEAEGLLDASTSPSTSTSTSSSHPCRAWGAESPRSMAFYASVRVFAKQHMFTLAGSTGDAWESGVTVYTALAAGSVPVWIHTNMDPPAVPCKACVISIRDFDNNARQLALHLKRLIANPADYASLLKWKEEPYDAKSYPDFERVRAHSADSAVCRIAAKAPPSRYRKQGIGRCGRECLEKIWRLQRHAPGAPAHSE
uniref:Fucosyltransferase n=1 Tax=Lotharella oceanica TaxID=641309 RepID=A0A7S2U442_9EUKA|mmetsp:Transcript_7255/g.14234  ORF Transcript_7255/g.14234 Transcript_7255/m.14234 type:complete len:377 (+) Transcript_7255:1-1131(+)